MPTFSYRAINDKGEIERSSLSARNREEAGHLLQQKNLTPIYISPKKQKKKILIHKKVSLLEKISFARYMGLMLRSGLSMSQGVDSLAQETTNAPMRKVLDDLAYGLSSGKPISSILESYPEVFDAIFISMIKAGEASGTLTDSFTYLADKLKAEYELQRQIKGAMVYPLIIFLALLGMGTILIVFVLPRIGKVFTTLDIDLPLPTRILLSTGQFFQKYITFIAPAIIICGFLSYFFLPRNKVKQLISRVLIILPITGKIVKRIDYARFTRTLGVLLKSGVSITKAADISFSTVTQPKISGKAPQIKKRLLKGENLSDILKQNKIFPAFITQMLTVGEKSGTLEEVLEEIGTYYAQEAEEDLKNIAQVIEPILILVVGVLVGLIVVSIIAPIYSLIGDLQIQ
jgi:type IV pilus assembly protein PilC